MYSMICVLIILNNANKSSIHPFQFYGLLLLFLSRLIIYQCPFVLLMHCTVCFSLLLKQQQYVYLKLNQYPFPPALLFCSAHRMDGFSQTHFADQQFNCGTLRQSVGWARERGGIPHCVYIQHAASPGEGEKTCNRKTDQFSTSQKLLLPKPGKKPTSLLLNQPLSPILPYSDETQPILTWLSGRSLSSSWSDLLSATDLGFSIFFSI